VPLSITTLVLALAAPPDPAACTDDPCPDKAKSCEVAGAYWHFECGHYSVAAEAFTDLYTRDPRAEFLFNAANARRLSGDCWTALALYKRFLVLGPPFDWVDLAQHNVQRCQAQIADARQEAARVGPPPPRAPVDTPTPKPAPTPRRKQWPRDPAGASLVGVGSVLVGVGAGLIGGGAWHRSAAADAPTDAEFGDRERKGLVLTYVGIPVLSAGAVALVAGIVRWAVLAKAEKKGRTRPTSARLSGAPR
jgi:hypothetical protein